MDSGRWGGDRQKADVAATRCGVGAAFHRGFGFLVLIALAVPILAHGCHRWDHDDEPVILPIKNDPSAASRNAD